MLTPTEEHTPDAETRAGVSHGYSNSVIEVEVFTHHALTNNGNKLAIEQEGISNYRCNIDKFTCTMYKYSYVT